MTGLAIESLDSMEADARTPLLALDIGSGTGAEAIPLLQQISGLRLIGLDLFDNMNEVFRTNATRANVSSDRYHLLREDVLAKDIKDKVIQCASDEFGASQFDIILSAFTLHHLKRKERASVFQLAHQLLKPCGIFLLGDLFNFHGESTWLTSKIFNWETAWIGENFTRAAAEAAHSGNTEESDHLRNLRDQWIHHYTEDNKLDAVTAQLNQLRSVGFAEVGNPFRYWQVGLICAVKS